MTFIFNQLLCQESSDLTFAQNHCNLTDIIIIGGGIVGLATALKIKEFNPNISVTILEKENEVAAHQTGHNSGVIHSGLYYVPGSLKALNCINGYKQMVEFCQVQGIDHDICGKVVVATTEDEVKYLKVLKERGIKNGLDGLIDLDSDGIKEYEPHVTGIAGLFVPQTGIVDYKQVANKYAELFLKSDGNIHFNEEVVGTFQNGRNTVVETTRNTFHSRYVINCSGLYTDKINNMNKERPEFRIIPFRGEYYQLREDKHHLVKNLIYPVPNPNFPFLGVHFTRMIGGGVEAGPNAVLAFKKEGYKKKDIRLSELIDTVTWPGFIKVSTKYWKTGFGEMHRSFSKAAFTRALQKLIPEIESRDLIEGGSGVRAQACDRQGGLIDDFMIKQDQSFLHVCNAPSPAATSSLAIADEIVSRTRNWDLGK